MPDICSVLSCPVCGGNLVREGKSLLCRNTDKVHTFDVSKEGYVNLLPPGRGRNSKSGDEAEMIRARTAFLETGAYDKLPDKVAALISRFVPKDSSECITVVDSGCGEGYHSIRFTKGVADITGRDVLLAAFDASKAGAAHAAKAAYRCGVAPKGGIGEDFDGKALASFMTGNIFSLPLKEGCADAVVSMFAPLAWEEMSRILKEDGIVVVTASGKDHLSEMREVIYKEVIKKESSPTVGEGFEEVYRTGVKYKITLGSGRDIMNLFGMTPFCHRTPAEAVMRLEAIEKLTLTVDTDYYVFRKKNKPN